MAKIYRVRVIDFSGKEDYIDLCNTEEQMESMTVLQLKKKIAEKIDWSGGEENLRLTFTNKQLYGDDTLLSTYGIRHMSVIQMVSKYRGGGTVD